MVLFVARGLSKKKDWLVNISWKNIVVFEFKFLSTKVYFSGGGGGVGLLAAVARTCALEGVIFNAFGSSTRCKAKASKK